MSYLPVIKKIKLIHSEEKVIHTFFHYYLLYSKKIKIKPDCNSKVVLETFSAEDGRVQPDPVQMWELYANLYIHYIQRWELCVFIFASTTASVERRFSALKFVHISNNAGTNSP